MKKNDTPIDVTRRDFLKGGSVATLLSMLGGVELTAQTPPPAAGPELAADQLIGPPINCAVIGLGFWGRDLVSTLTRLPRAKVVAVCDNYPAFLRRTATATPGAAAVEDYRKILDDKSIEAVVIATPSHQHREIAVAALQAGKHVYCEAPLATTIDDARAIASAAKNTPTLVFQAGLQTRSDPHRHFMLPFIRAGAQGKNTGARAQWHKKESWRRTSPNPDREKELNWRLRQETSPGLIGEIGIHQLDAVSWYLNDLPVSAHGFGSLIHWKDGREVPDTVQAVIEFPGGVRLMYDCSLANSFDAELEMYYGTDAAVMLRESKAWMFKEADAPLLGWEVYARKDSFYKEIGIALVANATKISAQTEKATADTAYTSTPLYHALNNFFTNIKDVRGAVEDFKSTFDIKDVPALREYLSSLTLQPTAGYKEGFAATVIALKINEAITKGEKVVFAKEWFDVA